VPDRITARRANGTEQRNVQNQDTEIGPVVDNLWARKLFSRTKNGLHILQYVSFHAVQERGWKCLEWHDGGTI